ncbi:MAG: YdcF family protein [Hyphomicrobiaceae bacterium]
MFFYLAKIFWFLVQPSGLLLILMIASAMSLRWGFERIGRRLLALAVLLLLGGGLLPVSNWLILPLEQRFPRAELSGASVSGIVVLGGAEDARIWKRRGIHAMNEAGERFTEAVALARRFPNARVVFTGGAVEILSEPSVGADAARTIFGDLGLREDGRLIHESKARDTWENAVNVKALVSPKTGERWLLVTSAWHMPRSVGVFRRVGFAIEPWPVDYRTADDWDALRLFDAPADGLKRLDTAMREWIGLLAYRATGRTDALFPAPGRGI